MSEAQADNKFRMHYLILGTVKLQDLAAGVSCCSVLPSILRHPELHRAAEEAPK